MPEVPASLRPEVPATELGRQAVIKGAVFKKRVSGIDTEGSFARPSNPKWLPLKAALVALGPEERIKSSEKEGVLLVEASWS